MSIKQGLNYIAGGGSGTGGGYPPDNVTTQLTEAQTLEAIGLKNKNSSGTTVYDWVGTLEEYNNGGTQVWYKWTHTSGTETNSVYTRIETPTENTELYTSPHNLSELTVDTVDINSIVLSDTYTYNKDFSNNLTTQETIGGLHPDWVCYIKDDAVSSAPVYTKAEVNTLLASKADNTDTVHKTGNETIDGNKTFTDSLVIKKSGDGGFQFVDNDIEKSVSPSSNQYNQLSFRDKNSKLLAGIESSYNTDKRTSAQMFVYDNTTSTGGYAGGIKIYSSVDGVYTEAPTPTDDTTSSTQIDTVGARNTKLSNYRTSSDQDIIDVSKQDKSSALNYNNISNCITEIPQDIKLELNDGTLTLKAGSKVYVPNGAGVFDIVNITSNLSYSNTELQHGMMLYYYVGLQRLVARVSNESGTSTPTAGGLAYYNINDNKIYQISGGSIADYSSFPIAKINTDSSGVTSVDQVFNGFGYIGSTVFALPGVKGLIPAGRNTDGSLKSIELNNTAVRTFNVSGTHDFGVALATSGIGTYYYAYDEKANKIYRTDTGAYYGDDRIIVGNISISSDKITSLNVKTPFHAVDYTDLSNKQDTLISGTNIKTVNGSSILGSGDLTISALQNTATGTNSLTLLGIPAYRDMAINIGSNSRVEGPNTIAIGSSAQAGNLSGALGYAVAIGQNASAIKMGTLALGNNSHANADNSIMLGYGINDEASSLYVGFDNVHNSYKLLGSDGNIPNDRLLGLLQTIYPVGSLYLTTNATCPLQALFGTWTLVSQDRVLQGAGTRGTVGTTLNESLPNIKGTFDPYSSYSNVNGSSVFTGALYKASGHGGVAANTGNANGIGFDASKSSSIYKDNAHVQQDAYLINVFKRTA